MEIITPRKTRWERFRDLCLSLSPQVKQGLIAAVVVIIGSVIGYFVYRKPNKDAPVQAQTATSMGNNSPAAVFSASSTGNNSPVTQTVINNGYPTNEMKVAAEKQDEMLAILRRMEGGMWHRNQEPLAKVLFTLGFNHGTNTQFVAWSCREQIGMREDGQSYKDNKWCTMSADTRRKLLGQLGLADEP